MRPSLLKWLGPSRNEGFIIVAVLWILAALATLASIIAVYVINAASAFAVHDERLQSEALTRAAIELAVYQIARDPQAAPTRGSFVFRMGNAGVATTFISEAARIDLNAAPKPLLAGLFVGLGAPRAAADSYADRILGWRAGPTPPQPGQADPRMTLDGTDESSLYRAAGLPYGPRGAPFQHIGELALVMGIPDFLVERALPYLTVYSGQGQINILDAAPQVLAALPGMSPGLLNEVMTLRALGREAAQGLLDRLGPDALASLGGSKSFRVTSQITFDSGQRVTSEVVVFILDNGTEPYRVLTWRDDIDG
jgi:general secretion pathway protein K